MTFRKGQSGNPRGRQRGSLDRRTDVRLKLLREAEPDIIKRLIQQALDGDVKAAGILMDRISPRLRPEARRIDCADDVPERASLADKASAILAQALRGDLPSDTAKALVEGLLATARIVEVSELEERLRKLEANTPDAPPWMRDAEPDADDDEDDEPIRLRPITAKRKT